MKRFLIILAILALAAPAAANRGVQVIDCLEDPPDSDIWHYQYFSCTGDFSADGLTITLTPGEIDEGSVVMGCSVPDLPGYDCGYDAESAWYVFPEVGAFDCVPGVPGEYLGITIFTPDEFTTVYEVWTLAGEPTGSFVTLVTCPVTPVRESAWGTLKSLY